MRFVIPRLSLITVPVLIMFSSSCLSQNLDVTFNANVIETTCEMKIEGGTGDGTNNTIPIGTDGKVRIDQIENGEDAVSTSFKIAITECPSSLASIKTTVSGQASSYVPTAITNTSGNGAAFLGISIARSSAPNTPFVINSTTDSDRLVWTVNEINSKEVSLIAKLVETSSGKGTTGTFSAVATFNFTYE